MTSCSSLTHRSHLLTAVTTKGLDTHHSDHYSVVLLNQFWTYAIVYKRSCCSLSKAFPACCRALRKQVWILQCFSRWCLLWMSELHHSFGLGNSNKSCSCGGECSRLPTVLTEVEALKSKLKICSSHASHPFSVSVLNSFELKNESWILLDLWKTYQKLKAELLKMREKINCFSFLFPKYLHHLGAFFGSLPFLCCNFGVF